MLWTIVAVLVILWLLGFVFSIGVGSGRLESNRDRARTIVSFK